MEVLQENNSVGLFCCSLLVFVSKHNLYLPDFRAPICLLMLKIF